MAKVTVIQPTINPLTKLPNSGVCKRKVAGYARVSTDSDEQFTSYEAQVDYYTKLIKSKAEWDFVKVYTDEGISGTNTKKRMGFQEMIRDALEGKIDLIVTKSVSRFARNTVDSLVTIRKLKEYGVECYFEKENIYTFDGKGELLITIMSSLAQEESRSISENITWGQRKSFSDGKVHMPYKNVLGYKSGGHCKPIIDEEQAKTVRLIYGLFLQGKTTSYITNYLMENAILTSRGTTKWYKNSVVSILKNEKYKGDALLQKKFTIDFLEKKQKKNEGEIPQYYVENSHPAIIEPEEWEQVQVELARRNLLRAKYSGNSLFASKLVCEDCGCFYGQKVWHSNDPYRKVIWQCNEKFKKEKIKCQTPTLAEDDIKQMFLKAYNSFMENREEVIDNCELMRGILVNFDKVDSDIDKYKNELDVIAELVNNLVRENASTTQSQEDYQRKYDDLKSRYDKVYANYQKAVNEKEYRISQDKAMKVFIKDLKEKSLIINEWNDGIWASMIEKAIVHKDKSITFVFYNKSEVKVEVA